MTASITITSPIDFTEWIISQHSLIRKRATEKILLKGIVYKSISLVDINHSTVWGDMDSEIGYCEVVGLTSSGFEVRFRYYYSELITKELEDYTRVMNRNFKINQIIE